jgi:hypothetical protein
MSNLKIPKLDSTNIQQIKKSILYKGPPGTGKTHNILSWPGKTVLVYFDTNLSTPAPYVKSGKVELWRPDNLDQLQKEILPAIRFREVGHDVENIGGDTLSSLASKVFHWLEGEKGANKYTWGRLKQVLDDVCWTMNSATFYKKGEASYNCLCATHVTDVKEGQGENIRVVKSNQPAIDGGFRDRLEGFFDNVLMTNTKPVTETVDGMITVTGQRFFCYAVAPTSKDTCKSQGLPPVVGGTYQELMAAWGEEVG